MIKIIAVIILFGSLFVSDASMSRENIADSRGPGVRTGGQCSYKSYNGTAKILSVRKMELPTAPGEKACERFEVKFHFQAGENIEKGWMGKENPEGILLLKNFVNPGRKFLDKYSIGQGKNLECVMRVIEKGTCTPILFDFPGLDLTDIC